MLKRMNQRLPREGTGSCRLGREAEVRDRGGGALAGALGNPAGHPEVTAGPPWPSLGGHWKGLALPVFPIRLTSSI